MLAGETRPSRIPQNEPLPRAGRPVPPFELSEDALPVWETLLDELEPMGVATSADGLALAILSEGVVQFQRANTILASSQPLVRGQKGNIVRNPAVQVWRDMAMVLRAYATEFGLTPAARARLEAPGEGGEGEQGAAGLLSA